MFRKIFKICFWSIGPILLVCLIFRCNYHHRIASDYNRVLDKMNLSLPSVKHVEASDNYDRGASRWDCLEYYIKFESPLPERTIKLLERRTQRSLNNWFREDRQSCIVYTYVSEREWKSDLFFLKGQIVKDLEYENDSAYIEYHIDEDEALFNFIFIGLVIAGMLMGLFLYAIISSFRSVRENS